MQDLGLHVDRLTIVKLSEGNPFRLDGFYKGHGPGGVVQQQNQGVSGVSFYVVDVPEPEPGIP